MSFSLSQYNVQNVSLRCFAGQAAGIFEVISLPKSLFSSQRAAFETAFDFSCCISAKGLKVRKVSSLIAHRLSHFLKSPDDRSLYHLINPRHDVLRGR